MAKRPLLKIDSTYPEGLPVGVHVLAGKFIGDQEGYGLLERIDEDIEDGRQHVILDLSGVEMANSSGLGILASIYNAAKKANGRTILVGCSDRLKQGLEIILLWNLLGHAESAAAALATLETS